MTLNDIKIKKAGKISYIAVNDLYTIRHPENQNRPEVEILEERVQQILAQHEGVVFFAYERDNDLKVWRFEIKERMGKMPDRKVLDIVVDYNRLMRWQCEAGESIEDLYYIISYKGEKICQ